MNRCAFGKGDEPLDYRAFIAPGRKMKKSSNGPRRYLFGRGDEPLDYKAFMAPPLNMRDSFNILKTKTKNRLVALFEKEQWAFGNEIVELADLEDFDPYLFGHQCSETA